MNESLAFAQWFLESPRGKHCKLLLGNLWPKVVSTSKKDPFWREIDAFSLHIYHEWIRWRQYDGTVCVFQNYHEIICYEIYRWTLSSYLRPIKRTRKQVKIRYSVIYKTTRAHSERILTVTHLTSPPFCKFVSIINDFTLLWTTKHNCFERQTQHCLAIIKINWTNPAWCIAWRVMLTWPVSRVAKSNNFNNWLKKN